MRPIVTGILAVLCWLGSTGLAGARQGPEPGPPGPPGPDSMAGDEQEIDRELAGAIEEVMVVQFKRRLDLTEEQARVVSPLMREMLESRRMHAGRRRDAVRSLAALSEDATADEADLRAKLDLIEREDEEFLREEKRRLGDIRAHLDVRQQARLLIFQERFRDEMRRRVDQARGRGPGGMPPPRGRGPRPRPGEPGGP